MNLVRLDPDHPGFKDVAYRARRDAIARAATDHRAGSPATRYDPTDLQPHLFVAPSFEALLANTERAIRALGPRRSHAR